MYQILALSGNSRKTHDIKIIIFIDKRYHFYDHTKWFNALLNYLILDDFILSISNIINYIIYQRKYANGYDIHYNDLNLFIYTIMNQIIMISYEIFISFALTKTMAFRHIIYRRKMKMAIIFNTMI